MKPTAVPRKNVSNGAALRTTGAAATVPAAARMDDHDTRSGSITDTVYEALWHDIVFGAMEPGQSLDELALVGRFGSSRTPIREAIARLSGDGLVVQHRNRGAYVSEIRISDLSAFFEALHLMQRAVTRLAAQRWNDEDLAAINAAASAYYERATKVDPQTALELDQALHLRIAAACRNSHLEGLYRRLLADQIRILVLHSKARGWKDPELSDQLQHSIEEHRELMDAITMRDADRAERLAGEHMRLIRKRVAAFASGEMQMSL